MCQHLSQGEEGRKNGNENGADRDVHPIDTLFSTAGYGMWNHHLGQRRDNVKRGMTSMSLFLLTGLTLLLVLCLPQSWFSLKKPVESHSSQVFTWWQSSNIASPLLPWMIITGLKNNADPLNYVSFFFFLNGKYRCITFQFILRGTCKEYQKWDGGPYHTYARIVRMVSTSQSLPIFAFSQFNGWLDTPLDSLRFGLKCLWLSHNEI